MAPASKTLNTLCLQACQSTSPVPPAPAQSTFSPQLRLAVLELAQPPYPRSPLG